MLLIISLIIVIVINAGLFGVAYTRQSDKLTDFSYALSFIVVAIAALLLSSQRSALLTVTVGMVIVWALRLGIFLVYRIRKTGKDARFDGIREDFFKFLKFWLGQGIVAWLLLLPILFLAKENGEWSTLSFVGIAIWLLGLIVEGFADLQKYQFSQNPANKGKWIANGVWHYSRHPNYFGEICVWIGVYITVVSSLSGIEQIIGLVSPLMIFITLRFISGVPPLEESAEKRWGTDPKFQLYKKRTNLLIPFWLKK
ncbi:MAG: DUF1295 domain-containing protein [Candidatus Saccharimonadales bacterium]